MIAVTRAMPRSTPGQSASESGRRASAEDRDRAAALRDRGAEGRDALARLHDLEDDENASLEEVLARSRRDRARAAADRAKAADDRAHAAADREHAARARAEALRHDAESADALKSATTDELTGAWTRRFGLDEATRELERAHRTGASLILAFVDVDGLKQVNDSRGHLAGDALLRLAGALIRSNLRPYDVILRYGGDEIVCAMPNLSTAEARLRFDKVAAVMSTADREHSVSFGVAESEPNDALEDLIARADANLLRARGARAGKRGIGFRVTLPRVPPVPVEGSQLAAGLIAPVSLWLLSQPVPREPRRFTMTTNSDEPTIDPTAEAEAQAKLTKSVGERLTPQNRDATVPLYKRWLKRTPQD